MPTYRLNSAGTLKKLTGIYRLASTGAFKKVTRAYRLNNLGNFKIIFSMLKNPIAKSGDLPKLYFVDTSNFSSTELAYSTYKMYLTRGAWTEDPISFSMKIQRSTSAGFTSPIDVIDVTRTYTSYFDSDKNDQAPINSANRPSLTNALIRAGNYYRGYVEATNGDGLTGNYPTQVVKPRIDASVDFTTDLNGNIGQNPTANGATFSWTYSGLEAIVTADVVSQTLKFYPQGNTSGSPLYTLPVTPGTLSVIVSDSSLSPSTSYTVTLTSVMNDLWQNESGFQTLATDFGDFATTAAKPPTPTNVTATDVGTDRPYNDGAVSLSWTQPTSSVTITGYKIEAAIGSAYVYFVLIANTGTTATSGTFTGLDANKNYKFIVTALSATSPSDPSAESNVALITTVPNVPTGISAVAGNAEASVSFTAPSFNGGKSITSYRATSTPGSITAEEVVSPIPVTGLTNYTSYTFTVAARNANGYSAESSASGSVTPVLPAPVGSGTVTIASQSASNYIYTATSLGTWSNSATTYDYDWQFSLNGGSTWSSLAFGTNQSTVANVNASGYAPYLIRLVVYGRNQTGPAITPLISNTLTIFYVTPVIQSFTVTGGELSASWGYAFTAPDPDASVQIEYKLSSASWPGTTVIIDRSTNTPGSVSLSAGTYDFRMFVTNSANGAFRIATASSLNKVVSSIYTFSFNNVIYPNTNGMIALTAAAASTGFNIPSSGKVLIVFGKDLEAATGHRWSGGGGTSGQDSNKYVYKYDGYEYGVDGNGNSKFGQSAYRIEYMVTFYTDQTYIDVKIITRGASVTQPTIQAGLYKDGVLVSSAGTPTLAANTTFRVNLASPGGSTGISYDEILNSAPNNIMLTMPALSVGTSDDGYWNLTAGSSQYNTPTVSFGTASNTTTSISVPFTESGGTDYITYNIRTGSYSGTIVDSGTDFTSPLFSNFGISSNTTYYITATPYNYKNQVGTTAQTTTTTPAPDPTASGFARSDSTATPSQPSTISFSSSNNQVTSTWTNGSPITSVFYSYSGAGTNGSLTDNTAPFVTSDTTSYSQSGTFTMNVFNYNDNMQVTFSWNQSNARSYRIFYNHSVLGNNFVINGNNTGSSASAIANFTTAGTITWSSLTVYSGDNQTGTSVTYSNPTFSISVPRPESSRTNSVSLTYVLPNLITNPAYGAASPIGGGWNASISTQPNPTGGTYTFVSATAGSATVNSSSGLISASGLSAGQSSTVTVNYNRSGYNAVNITASGTALTKLGTPSNVAASDNRTDGVNITWTAVSGASYYGVWYGGTPSYDSLADFGGNRNTSLITGTSYLETTLGVGTNNYYVQAYRSGDPTGTKSEWGGPDSGTRLSSTPPATPTNFAISVSGLCTWDTVSNATSYTVEWYAARNSTGTLGSPTVLGPFTNNTTTNSFQITYPTSGGFTYNYVRGRVRANNAAGSSAYTGFFPSSTTYT